MTTADQQSYRWIVPLVFLFGFAYFYGISTPLMDDTDVPWHLVAGKLLLETHHVPDTDPWAITHSTWYLMSWVWDIVLGSVERIGGLLGVYIFTHSLYAGLLTFIAMRLLKLGMAPPVMMLTVMLAGLCLFEFSTARPHLAGYVLVLIFQALLHDSRKSERYGKLLWLPPLMLLWANAHGSFIAGFTILAAYIAEAWFTKNHAWLKRLIIISLSCGVTALINPYGLAITLGAMQSLTGVARKSILEWLPFTFSLSTGLSAWLLLFIIASNLRVKKTYIADKLLAVAWLVAFLFIIRNGPIFILLSATYLAACLEEQTDDLREIRPFSPFAAWLSRQPIKRVWIGCLALYVLVITTLFVLPHEDRIRSEENSAMDAIQFAMEHYPHHRYLTDFNLGGQVVYYSGGTLAYFMDSRAQTAYSEQNMLDYLDFMNLRPGWEKIFSNYKLNAILIGNNVPFTTAYKEGRFNKEWKLVFAGKAASVYIARP